MNRIFFLCFVCTALLFPQTEILSYDAAVSIDERTSAISGTLNIQFRPSSASAIVTLFVPNEYSINTVRNAEGEPFTLKRGAAETGSYYKIELDLDDEQTENDTIRAVVDFFARIDSASNKRMFIRRNDFFLTANDSFSWLPHFGNLSTERFSLSVETVPTFQLYSGGPFTADTASGKKTWQRHAEGRTSFTSAFTLCGIKNAVEQRSLSADSLVSIQFVSSSEFFHQKLASDVTRQMNDAFVYFSSLTGREPQPIRRTFVFVGNGLSSDPPLFDNGEFVVQSNARPFGLYDSLLLTSTEENHWVGGIARSFCPPAGDSMALFDDGLSSYLTMRFLSERFPRYQLRERFRATANALTFFPSGTISAGRTVNENSGEYLSSKGAYIFLMLESIVGRESFDAILRQMVRRIGNERITFPEFRSMCEKEYGSSLEWFFDQWLNRRTSPEPVAEWRTEKTVRGMFVVRVSIEQRGDLFTLPIPLLFSFGNRTITKRIVVAQQRQQFSFTFPSAPTNVELDPQLSVLRWLLEIRISAHARTALQFLTINKDTVNAEREAYYAMQLDPNNATGIMPLSLYVLGNVSAIRGNFEKAKEHFFNAMSFSGAEQMAVYRLKSLLRYANIVEMESSRNESIPLYHRAVREGMSDPVEYERCIIEAERYLRSGFIPSPNHWFINE